MCDLVARTGRHQQRYEDGCRLVAGCIPYRYRNCDGIPDEGSKKVVEVLMINSTSGPGLLFPKLPECGDGQDGSSGFSMFFKLPGLSSQKGGWENDETVEQAAEREALEEAGVRGDIMSFLGCYHFKSKSHQDEFSPEGLCKAEMFALHVKEELGSWPEQSTRYRSWVTIPEALEQCRHPWMRDALVGGFSKWHESITSEAEEDNSSR